MPYHDLMRAVFPQEDYPRAFNYQANGGPPGCVLAFTVALNKMRCYEDRTKTGFSRGKVILPHVEIATARDEAARRSQHEKARAQRTLAKA